MCSHALTFICLPCARMALQVGTDGTDIGVVSIPRIQYEYLVGKGESIENQIQLLEAHAEKARAANAALPPGFRAHFGMLYLANGNSIAAQQMWRSEKVAFPESVVYMDTLLKRLNKSTPSKAGVTEK